MAFKMRKPNLKGDGPLPMKSSPIMQVEDEEKPAVTLDTGGTDVVEDVAAATEAEAEVEDKEGSTWGDVGKDLAGYGGKALIDKIFNRPPPPQVQQAPPREGSY